MAASDICRRCLHVALLMVLRVASCQVCRVLEWWGCAWEVALVRWGTHTLWLLVCSCWVHWCPLRLLVCGHAVLSASRRCFTQGPPTHVWRRRVFLAKLGSILPVRQAHTQTIRRGAVWVGHLAGVAASPPTRTNNGTSPTTGANQLKPTNTDTNTRPKPTARWHRPTLRS